MGSSTALYVVSSEMFSGEGVQPWLPVRSDYIEQNVEAQNAASESHLKVYQALASFRQSNAFKLGNTLVTSADTVFAFNR